MKNHLLSLSIVSVASAALLAVTGACLAGGEPAPPAAAAPAAAPAAATHAAATVAPTQGSTVAGTVTFTAGKSGVHVVADLTGLTPGEHGFHIHEKGDCSAPDGTSAGGHFNPAGHPHGAPGAEHHAGDLGNITAGTDGKAHLEADFPSMSMAGADSVVGRAVIVHAGVDDLKTQPTGNAGGRLACGVIKAG
ncbi:MAG TPA: superoxide dismutase family protein [Dongiaceae bacterium]|nr:superoxide dismutase family protein [Dongiaceae bacterium]